MPDAAVAKTARRVGVLSPAHLFSAIAVTQVSSTPGKVHKSKGSHDCIDRYVWHEAARHKAGGPQFDAVAAAMPNPPRRNS
ncbi:hypothetical protein GCM10011614_14230 [Novosphingobium colocasiae]|uniref:Uncharacterized protein n=1 Tax=Novosphingobium colocasiae TaxID=1256513 RepID=A0A918UFB5_9SPHN|nr:hypothetical protein GCM10011614_14230 [Novosphingobium colocasiae]